MKLSDKVSNISVSPTMAVAARAIELKNEGVDLVDLVVGEPDFPTPENIKQAAKNALDNNLTQYTENNGLFQLRTTIKEKYKKEYELEYSENKIIVSNGAKQCVFNAIQALVSKGDEVIIPSPYYVSYPHMVKIADGTPIFVETKELNGFKLTPKLLENSISDKTKLLILCNPCNPTGAVHTKDELEEIVSVAKQHNLFILADEVYEKLIFDELQFVSLAKVAKDYLNNIVIVNGMSKTYAMTGWRIGYSLANKEIISAMGKIQSHTTSGANSISQYASIEALSGPQGSIEQMKNEFEKRRNYLHTELNKIDGFECYKSEGAFYLFPNINHFIGKTYNGEQITNSVDFVLFLLNEAKVAIVPGSAFGADGYVRFSYATKLDILKEAVKRIRSSINKLT